MPHHIQEVLAHLPPERLMIGSDLPESAEVEIGKIQTLALPEQARRQILWETAYRLFG